MIKDYCTRSATCCVQSDNWHLFQKCTTGRCQPKKQEATVATRSWTENVSLPISSYPFKHKAKQTHWTGSAKLDSVLILNCLQTTQRLLLTVSQAAASVVRRFCSSTWFSCPIAPGLQTLSYCGLGLIGFLDVAHVARRGDSKEVRAAWTRGTDCWQQNVLMLVMLRETYTSRNVINRIT